MTVQYGAASFGNGMNTARGGHRSLACYQDQRQTTRILPFLMAQLAKSIVELDHDRVLTHLVGLLHG